MILLRFVLSIICPLIAQRQNGSINLLSPSIKKGIAILKIDPALAAQWKESFGPDEEIGNRWPAWDWSGAAIGLNSDIRKTARIPSSVLEELRIIFTSENYEALFLGLTGCGMTVANCRPFKSYPHNREGVGPQQWHGDGCPPGVIRGVLYLTDVDEDCGPFQYKSLAGIETTVFGKIGDLLIFDASRLLHRAMPPSKKVRQVLDFVFMPRLPETNLTVNAVGSNSWPCDPFCFERPIDNRANTL